MTMVRFGAKGQVVIPGRLLKEFGIAVGTVMAVVLTPEGILLKPPTGHAFLKVCWKVSGFAVDGNPPRYEA